ncbi:Ig-like domain-containing protein [Kibdelosporangium aridum]|uniref:Ig-like domain-containing protein n=1 Tax=Kibdelosporangium aridum TaxID=2030 RepID=A0A1W2D4P6_KIBAR|nr:Ig-like domain-containing protein [Kibdelosporangium aridum]
MRSVFRRSRRRIAHLVGVALVAANVTVLGVLPGSTAAAETPAPCAPPPAPPNPVACENLVAPNNAGDWMITAIDDTIAGFTDNISYTVGETVRFKVKTDAPRFRYDIYRLGYYGGAGARKIVDNVEVINTVNQPNCFEDNPAVLAQDTGIVDCGNWSTSMTWTVPNGMVSGVYYTVLRRDYGNGVIGESDIVFVVRDDASTSDIMFQTADATWQAYNTYGNRPTPNDSPRGNSFYTGTAQGNGGSAYKVSYNRPIIGGEQENFFFNAEYPMLLWLEKNGYDVTYTTNVDMSRRGHLLKNHKVYMPVGHDEYWSNEQRAAVEDARNAGVNMAFMTGNEIFWKTRWEQSQAGPATNWRTLVCYKETKPGQVDPHPTEWTGTWRDGRKSPPKDGGRPENALLGQIFTVNGERWDQLVVPPGNRLQRLWRNTPTMGTLPSEAYVFKPGTLGYEWDTVEENGFQPPGVAQLSRTTVTMNDGNYVLQNEGDVYAPGTKTHALTLYKHQPSGALVFAAGSVQWSWGLENKHIRNQGDTADPRIRQATANLLADMDNVQPRTPRDITPATMTTDTTAPTVVIGTTVSPVVGSAYTFSGTVSDLGGRPAGVEVSVDGTSWRAANWQAGSSSWNYTYTPSRSGPATFRVRAVDDSANLSGEFTRNVTVNPRACPCSIWADNTVPATPDSGDGTALELGVKFQAASNGYVRGVRFYKGIGNTGSHTGSLWTTDGTLLATGTFLNETALGWQTLTFPESVAITANTTYIASYHTNTGHYAADANYFTNSSTGLEPLTALQGTATNPNGVFKVGASGFPDRSYQNANYWVDVVYGYDPGPDTRAPLVASTSPVTNGGSVALNVKPTISFDEPLAPASLQFSLTGPSGSVPGTYALSADGKTATFTPNQPLSSGTTYTAQVRASDNAGNSIPNPPYSWSFTTGNPRPATCPCTIWDDFATPAVAAVNDPAAVELGTKVRFDSRGTVHGIRFYKGPGNTGTHTGSLWTSTGTRVATGTFTNESGGGWQTLLFNSPVSVQSGTTYVVSYYAPNGRYSGTSGYFNGVGADYGAMHALPSGVDGNNGVYRYGAGGGFPTNSYGNTNYWVDVIWQAGANGDSTPPTVTSTNPPNAGTGASLTAPVSATLNEPVDLPTAQYTVKDSGGAVINGTLSLSADQRTVSWTPAARLTAGATYTASLKIADVNGNIMPTATTWSFTTTLTQTCPCSLFSEATVPTVTAANDSGNYELGVRFSTSADGFITAVKFYKGTGNTGTHTGSLWTAGGQQLATGTFTNETATGWQTLTFATPVAVQAGQSYVASYTAPNGRYAADGGYFNRTAVTSVPLSAPLSGPGNANGVYKAGPGFPTSTFQGGNYWVDVVFTP